MFLQEHTAPDCLGWLMRNVGSSADDVLRSDYRLCPIARAYQVELELDDMRSLISGLLFEDGGHDIAEYAAILAVILLLIFSTIRLIHRLE
jgi:hypothetical protein